MLQIQLLTVFVSMMRLRNVYLVAPLHLEFDFSGKTVKKILIYFKHTNLGVGLGDMQVHA
jgi:hypothetical protein